MISRIAIVGSNMMDLVTYVDRMPAPGETLEAPSFEIGHGGKGANQAIAAAKLGSSVVMVSKVGSDDFANATIANFVDHGIDVTYVTQATDVSSGVAPIFVERSGENSILIVKGANDRLSPEDVDAAADLIAGCSIILLQLEIPLRTVYHTIALAKARDIPVLLNPAPAARELDVSKISSVRFLIPNETELALMTGMPVASEDEINSAARSLIARGIGTVIVTMGARGALLVNEEGSERVPPARVDALDTTGAGDAFIGSFAHFYGEGASVEVALHDAALYAADSITRRGTQRSYADAQAFTAVKMRHAKKA